MFRRSHLLLHSIRQWLPFSATRKNGELEVLESEKSEPVRLALLARAQRSGHRPKHHHKSRDWSAAATADLEVLITAFQYRQFLPKAVQSATTALHHFMENGGRGGIAVIEDCGRDGSWAWLQEHLQRSDVPMRILQPRENIGLAAARNLVLKTTSAKTLFVLDADNEVDPTGLTALHHHLSVHPAVAAYGQLRVMNTNGEHIRDLSGEPPNREFLLTKGNHIDAMALYSTEALREAGGWDAELLSAGWGLEDYALWIHWLVDDKLPAFLPEYVGNYLAKSDSMSNAYNPITEQQVYHYLRQKYGPQVQVGLNQHGG